MYGRYEFLTFYVFLTLTIMWFIFMTYLSHQDGEHTGRTSRKLAEELSEHICFLGADINALNGKLRRFAHIVVFAVLTVLLGFTLQFGELSMWWLIIAPVWSYVDEATKPLIQGRHFSWFDVGQNLIGTVIGAVVVWIL